jgi:metallo-beta-lactamase family protein
MRVRFLGAAQQVTGSMHLLETREGSILIDCGLFQGRRDESREKNSHLPKEAVKADVMILTHAHIDHSGSVPTLVKQGFEGDIYATPATRDLCAHMLRDSAKIQMGDAEYLNKKFADDPNFKPVEPLYDDEDAVKAIGQFATRDYRRRWQVLPGVHATFLDAGHILGSAGVMIDVDEGKTKRRVVFSGDIGRKGLPILRDPEHPQRPVDYVLMESTYGNRVHGDIKSMHDDLERVVKETVQRGGKIIVPAFAVGRTQEVIYALNYLKREGRLPDIPVFVDSPLSVNVTEVFRVHPECFDKETRAFLDEHGEVFDFKGVRFVQSKDESIRLNSLKEPAIIIASSGMCEAGRVVHHLKNNIEDPKNTVMVVGFMAQHTLGRRLVEKRPRVRIFGVERDLRAQVVVMNSFSAHADKNELFAYARACGDTRRVFLIHGEPEQQEPFAAALNAAGQECTVPAPGTVVELD